MLDLLEILPKKDHNEKYYFAETVFDNPYGVLFYNICRNMEKKINYLEKV